jgi:chemotaxis protein CheC
MEEEKQILSQAEIDQIKIISESASKAAAQALSKMINKEATVSYPSLSLKPVNEISVLDSSNLLAISDVTGDVSGNILVCHDIPSGLKLVEFMMGSPQGSLKEVDENVVSAYKEFVNIVAGAYLSNLANFLGFKIFPQVPKFAGEFSKVQQELVGELTQDVGKLLMVKTQLTIDNNTLSGNFFIILDETSLKKIILTIRDQS